MKYSYIKPRKKSIFTSEVQLLVVFFSITILMLLLTYLFLVFKDYRFKQDRLTIIQQRADINISIHNMQKNIAFKEKETV